MTLNIEDVPTYADFPLYTLALPPLRKEAATCDRMLDREYTVKNDSGARIFTHCWKDQKRNGLCVLYYNGRAIHSIQFHDGKRWREEKIYNHVGQLVYDAYWINNKLFGTVEIFHPADGKMCVARIKTDIETKSVEYPAGEDVVRLLGWDVNEKYLTNIVRSLLESSIKGSRAELRARNRRTAVSAAALQTETIHPAVVAEFIRISSLSSVTAAVLRRAFSNLSTRRQTARVRSRQYEGASVGPAPIA